MDATTTAPAPDTKQHAAASAKAPPPETVEGSPGLSENKVHVADLIPDDPNRTRETFIPVTRQALVDRLTRPQAWMPGEAAHADRFFTYLAYWRQQQYQSKNIAIEQAYEPFNPDTDLLQTRQYTDVETFKLQKRLVSHVRHLLEQANYVRIRPDDVEIIMTAETHYGLDFHIDLEAFEELLIFYRGASTRKDQRRTLRKFFRKTEFDVPVYQRLFILFKLKPEEQRIEEIMRARKIGRKQATKAVRNMRERLPPGISDTNIYMKMFRDIPRADIEMIFPNTRVKFRMLDKVKIGVTSVGGLGAGVAGAAGKVGAALSNPIAALMLAGSFGGLAFRQVMGAVNQHQKYMVVMAQNLYFHSLADNRGVLVLLADRAAEEDVKEEILLYSVLAKEQVNRADLPAVDRAIEQFLLTTFGVDVDFDLEDALGRLIGDGIVTEGPDGTLTAAPPREAALRIDALWDAFLDQLPSYIHEEGTEFVGRPGGARRGPRADVDHTADAAQ